MRWNTCMVAMALAVAAVTADAAVRFTEPVWRADLGISMPGLADSVAEPVEMPKAVSFLVTSSDGAMRLEDRFDTFDLWSAATLRGRWRNSSGSRLYLARLSTRPPSDAPGTVKTRRGFMADQAEVEIDAKSSAERDEAAVSVSPVDIGKPVRPRRSQRRNMTGLVAYACTNENVVACAFRPRSPERGEKMDWYFAVLVAAEGDETEFRRRFDEDFLDKVEVPPFRARPSAEISVDGEDEASLLKADVRRTVANYDEWHFADSEDVTVIDDLAPGDRTAFVASLTNELPEVRRLYAASAPTPLAETNRLAVVRVFGSRQEYLAYVGVEHAWTAAVWSPLRRELVLHLPSDGVGKLMETVRHEAFHQYLAYAGAMVEASPWFNEGHAQLFEHVRFDSHTGKHSFGTDADAALYVNGYADELAKAIPDVLEMDYREFYDGSREEVEAKYRLVLSIAYFLEVGAPNIRFRPYESLRADYMKALVSTRSMSEATRVVLPEERREKFIADWLAFWKKR